MLEAQKGTLEILLREFGPIKFNSSDPSKHEYVWVDLDRETIDNALALDGVDVSKISVSVSESGFDVILTEPIG